VICWNVFIHSHGEWSVKCRKDTCLDKLHFWNRTIITIIQKIQYFSIHIWLKLLHEYTLLQYDCIPSLTAVNHRKQWLISALLKQLSIAQCIGYPTYWSTNYDKEEHLADNMSFISSLNILLTKEHDDFSRLYWIPKLHNNPYRGNNTTGAYSFWR
jgi:hypothetical protein